MPAEHAILGLLALSDHPGHGYELARSFGEGEPLGEVLHLEAGMLYHHLKKLERAGWVSRSTESQANRPARQLFAITPAGRAELERWLREPVSHTREIRLEFLVKLYFARRIDAVLAAQLIAEQKERLGQVADALATQTARSSGDRSTESDREFARLVLELRRAQTRTALAWLERVH